MESQWLSGPSIEGEVWAVCWSYWVKVEMGRGVGVDCIGAALLACMQGQCHSAGQGPSEPGACLEVQQWHRCPL